MCRLRLSSSLDLLHLFIVSSVLWSCGQVFAWQRHPCIRECAQIHMSMAIFLSSDVTNLELESVKQSIADQIERCFDDQVPFYFEIYLPPIRKWLSCCDLEECRLKIDSVDRSLATVIGIPHDHYVIDDDYCMYQTVYERICMNVTAPDVYVYLVADYGTRDTYDDEQNLLAQATEYDVFFMPYVLSSPSMNASTIATDYFSKLGPVPVEMDQSPLSISELYLHVKDRHDDSRFRITPEELEDCLNRAENSSEPTPFHEAPINLRVFFALSEDVSTYVFGNVTRFGIDILQTFDFDDNPGTITITGPRQMGIADCSWSTMDNCLKGIQETPEATVKIHRNESILDQDMDFAPDVMNYLHDLSFLHQRDQLYFAVIISDFITMTLPRNDFFFMQPRSRQNLTVIVVVIATESTLTEATVLDAYRNVTDSEYIVVIESMDELIQLRQFFELRNQSEWTTRGLRTTSSMLTTATTTEATTTSTSVPSTSSRSTRDSTSTKTTTTSNSLANTSSSTSEGSSDTAPSAAETSPNRSTLPTPKSSDFESSTTSTIGTADTVTSPETYPFMDTVVAVAISKRNPEYLLPLVKEFLEKNMLLCLSLPNRRFMIYDSADNSSNSDSAWCRSIDCVVESVKVLNRTVNVAEERTEEDQLTAHIVDHARRRLTRPPTGDHQSAYPALVLITDFVSIHFASVYHENDAFRLSVSQVNFRWIVLNVSNAAAQDMLESSSIPNAGMTFANSPFDLLKTTNLFCDFEQKSQKRGMTTMHLVLIICSSALVLLVATTIFCFFRYKNRYLGWRKRVLQFRMSEDSDSKISFISSSSQSITSNLEFLSVGALSPKCDPWEMDRQQIVVDKGVLLGKGSFGLVYKGALIGKAPIEKFYKCAFFAYQFENSTVAVKMLPGYIEDCRAEDFRHEIRILKSIGYHPNLSILLGCVTASAPLCMVLEYAKYGDMAAILRSRKLIQNTRHSVCTAHAEDAVCTRDLLAYLWQSADAMMFLHDRGFVHRDLAARNVLLRTGRNVMISDFGLCIKKFANAPELPHSKMPIKWMAIEALRDAAFTEKSDVWSFGVLLYEFFSMGKQPYPDVPLNEFLKYLLDGNRLQKPDDAPKTVWRLAEECFDEFPDRRPSFARLREQLSDNLVESSSDYGYLDLSRVDNENSTNPLLSDTVEPTDLTTTAADTTSS